MVLGFHLAGSWSLRPFAWGFAGVNLFFVLSGFLITGILYDSIHNKDYFRNFYVRRALRIFPLYFGVLIVLGLLSLVPGIHAQWTVWHLTWPLYLGNLFVPGSRLGNYPLIELVPFRLGSGPWYSVNIGHFWSLCVEEQFYLVWPAVVFLVRDRKRLLTVCIAVILLEPVARLLYLNAYPAVRLLADTTYINTAFRADSLLMGGAVALWLRGTDPSLPHVRRWAGAAVVLAPLLLLTMNHFTPGFHVRPLGRLPVATVGFTLIDLTAAALLLLTIDPASIIARALRIKPLAWIGRISYGIYVLHMFLFDIVPWVTGKLLPTREAKWFEPIIAISLSILLGWLSFHYFESWFLRLKPRLAPRHIPLPPHVTAEPRRDRY